MIDSSLYSMLNKRKSQRSFSGSIPVSKLDDILSFSGKCQHLADIKSVLKAVPVSETSCSRGEYALCCYSEESPYALIDTGYYLEQLDLYAESIGIGVCWYGFGRTSEKTVDGMPFRIMLDIGNGVSLRPDGEVFHRNDSSLFWIGEGYDDVKRDVRLAPSACNSQPWLVESEGSRITVMRGAGNPSLLKGNPKKYFNLIDMGIFLCFLELSLNANGYGFERKMLDGNEKIAEYIVIKQR